MRRTKPKQAFVERSLKQGSKKSATDDASVVYSLIKLNIKLLILIILKCGDI